MKRTGLVRRSPLRRVSKRRLEQLGLYWTRRERFLREHPYCQLWLAEHGVPEDHAIREKGILRFGAGLCAVFVPRATIVHHVNKRRGPRLLDERYWMAVCWTGHERIETNKAWSRAHCHLMSF